MLPLIWQKLLKISNVRLTIFSPPSFLITIILIQQYLGFIFLYFEVDPFRVYLIGGKENIIPVFLYSSFVITQILIGYIFSKECFGGNVIYFKMDQAIYFRLIKKEMYWIIFLLILGTSVLVKYISVIGYDNIPIFVLLNNFEFNDDFGVMRSNMTNNFSGSYHWYRIFMFDILRLACFSSYSIYLLKKSKKYFIIFLLAFVISSISSLITSEKGPFLWNLISLYIVYCIIKYNGHFKFKRFFILGIILLFIASIMYSKFLGISGVTNSLMSIFSRSIMGAITPLGSYIDIFPEKLDFLYGRSFPNPRGILPFQHVELTQLVMDITIPDLKMNGIVGSRPTFFWGELYANFGPFGLLLIPLLVGAFLYFLSTIIMSLPPSSLSIGFIVWFISYTSNLAKTSLSNFILPIKPGFVFIFMFMGLVFSGYYKTRNESMIKNNK